MADLIWRSNRSKEPYKFSDTQVAAIFKTCADARLHDYAIDTIWSAFYHSLETTGPSLSITPKKSNGPRLAGLGKLSIFPVELLQIILLNADVESILHFRQTSNTARNLVHSIPEYRAVLSHAPIALHAIVKTKSACHITLSGFYNLLCSSKCHFCPGLGESLHIPTWQRVCKRYSCVSARYNPLPMVSSTFARKKWGTSQHDIQRFYSPKRGLGSLTGAWKGEHRQQLKKTAKWLVSYDKLLSFNRNNHDGEALPVSPQELEKELRVSRGFYVYCKLPHFDKSKGTSSGGFTCRGCTELQKSVGSGHHAVFARLLRHTVERRLPEAFLSHFTWCKGAQAIWESTQNGTICPPIFHAPTDWRRQCDLGPNCIELQNCA